MNKEAEGKLETDVDDNESTTETCIPKVSWDDEYDNWHPHF
jgi:hypothetical protein